MSNNTTETRRFLAGDIVKFKDENDERLSSFARRNNIHTFKLVYSQDEDGDVRAECGAVCGNEWFNVDDIELVTPTPHEERMLEIMAAIKQKNAEIEELREEGKKLVASI